LIKTVVELGGRHEAAQHLGIPYRTVENALYRAFRALKVSNIGDAMYLISHGFERRDNSSEPVDF
jgi:hypothetical protein